jgi:BirA family biotin operon repressor/biotin-[acetyl-CoA-carboxylase] ligase
MSANSVVEICDSTNDLCRALGEEGNPSGTWISARRQSAGRGRLGRSWISQEGNLFLSYLFRPTHRDERTSWVPLAAGVALLSAAEACGAGRGLALKWPNDLWRGEAKAGGILCEGVSGPKGFFIVIGIGANCASEPAALGIPVASLGVSVDELRPALIRELDHWLGVLDSEGPTRIREAFLSRSILAPGIVVVWQGRTGQVTGLGASGELQVLADDTGKVENLLAEDVSVRPRAGQGQ